MDPLGQLRHRPLHDMLRHLEVWARAGKHKEPREALIAFDHLGKDLRLRASVAAMYGGPLVRGGEQYACSIFPSPECQQNLDRRLVRNFDGPLLAPLGAPQLKSDLKEMPGYLSLVMAIRDVMPQPNDAWYDGQQFAMKAMHAERGKPIILECWQSRYFWGMATCECMRLELFKAFEDLGRIPRLEDLRHRPAINAAAQPDPLLCGLGRAATLAVSTLTCYVEDGRVRCYLRRRSKTNLAFDRDLLHVIPAGMFEVDTEDAASSYSVFETLLRETAEECFPSDTKEMKNAGRCGHRWYRTIGGIKKLLAALEQRKASLHFAGMVVSHWNLRPEIVVVLFLSDPSFASEWFESISENWEYAGRSLEDLAAERPYMDCSDDEVVQQHNLQADKMVTVGAGAFWLGRDVARRLAESLDEATGVVRAQDSNKEEADRRTVIGSSMPDQADALLDTWGAWWDPSTQEDTSKQVSQKKLDLLRAKKMEFRLFVDECERQMWIKSSANSVSFSVTWDDAGKAGRAFLGVLLRALRSEGGQFTGVDFMEAKKGPSNEVDEWNECKKTKVRLNKTLGMLLDEILWAPDQEHAYAVKRISYCWIRPSRDRSYLFAGSPEK